MQKRFTIIIIHKNGKERLLNLINSLLPDITNKDQIIICDNNSKDDSLNLPNEILQNKFIKIIRNSENKGYGIAANQVINHELSKFYLICNNDIVMPKNYLNNFESSFIKNSNIGMITGQLYDLKNKKTKTSGFLPTFLSEFDGIGRFRHSKDSNEFSEIENVRGACLAVKSDLINDIGSFNEKFFFYFEDTEWCYRIKKSKWSIFINPSIKIKHMGGASTESFFYPTRIEFFRSRIIFWYECFGIYACIVLLSWNMPKMFLDTLFYLIMTLITLGKSKKFRNKFLERIYIFLWILLGLPRSWRLNKK